MFKIERQEQLLHCIDEKSHISIAELSKLFQVSKVTIRSDLEELEAKGLISRTHGGAVSKRIGISSEIPLEIKKQEKIGAKKKIGKAAARFVEEDDVIILDSGSTTCHLVEHLPEGVTVITTDILIAVEVMKLQRDIHLIMPGGDVDKSVYTLKGVDTVRFFENHRADKVFLGCDALDFDYGITDRSGIYAEIKRSMIEAADQVILLADARKFHKKLLTRVCAPEKIHRLVTDQAAPSVLEKCEKAGIQVTLA